MNLGFFTMPIHPLDKDWRLSLKEDREAFLLADELGFTEAYVGEHVTDKAENITSCIAFLAWIAGGGSNISRCFKRYARGIALPPQLFRRQARVLGLEIFAQIFLQWMRFRSFWRALL